MFNFVIVTSKVTPEISNTIQTLLDTKTMHDKIIVINYNNYNIKYRSIEGIDYRHVKQNKKQAINSSLPRDANVVLLDNFDIPTSFVKNLYKHYDFKSLCSLRVDVVTEKKFVESDGRIGSVITPKSFKHLAIAFNTGMLSKVGNTPEETALIAQDWKIPLKLLPNV
ncbi:MAG: hypothetical protein KAS32_03155, partial [Candidatus Peribacteraceae bacterium]|nr:hypothetical protein [Candidatus Peribacteraceae bacterium]